MKICSVMLSLLHSDMVHSYLPQSSYQNSWGIKTSHAQHAGDLRPELVYTMSEDTGPWGEGGRAMAVLAPESFISQIISDPFLMETDMVLAPQELFQEFGVFIFFANGTTTSTRTFRTRRSRSWRRSSRSRPRPVICGPIQRSSIFIFFRWVC